MSLNEVTVRSEVHDSYKGKSLRTVGELKKALAGIEDNVPLAFHDRGFGYRVWVFLSQHELIGSEGISYYSKDDPNKGRETRKLPQEACILEPTHR